MRKLRKIVRAIVVTLLLLLVVVPASVYIIVSTPWAQEKLREVATSQLSSLLGTEVEFGNIVYHPFSTLSINGVRVSDDYGRPALAAARIATRFELFTFIKTGRLDFDYVLIDAPEITLYKQSADEPLNISNIIAHLKPADKNKPPTEFQLKIGTVVIRHGRLNYDIMSAPDSTGHFTPSHIHAYDINLYAYLRQGSREAWNVDIESLSLKERSGLVITDLSTGVTVSPELIALRGFNVEMPNSHLSLKPIELRINGYNSIERIINSRSVLIEPTEAVSLDMADFTWLTPAFDHLNTVIRADFAIDAALREINITRFNISDDKGSELEMMGAISRLDSIDGLEFNILRINLKAPAASTASIISRFNPGVARAIGHAGDIYLHGSGRGDLHGATLDFNATARGARLAFNGKVATPDRYKSFTFNGRANITDLDIKAITGNEKAGMADASLNGHGLVAPGNIKVEGTLEIPRLQWNGYTYTGITTSGTYDKLNTAVNLDMASTDPNASFRFRIEAEPHHEYKTLALDGEISRLNTSALNLGGKAGYTLSAKISADAGGTSPDDLDGNITISDVSYLDSIGDGLNIRELAVDLDRSGSEDILTLRSDIINGNITGRIIPTTLVNDIKRLGAEILPDVISIDEDRNYDETPNDFSAEFTIANAEEMSHFFKLPVTIIYPVDITASLDGINDIATFTLDAPYLQQGDKIIDQTVATVEVDGNDRRATVFATTHMPTKKGPMTAVLGVSGSENRFDTRIDWIIDRKIPLNGQINFSTLLDRSESGALCVDTDFNPGQINFGDNVWEIATSSVNWCDNHLVIKDFSLISGDQAIAIDGTASAFDTDTVNVVLRNISLAPIFETLEIDKALIGGRASGSFTATSAFSKMPALATDNLHVDSIGYNYCTLGDADVKANWNNERQSFFLDADIVNPEGQHSRIWGDIYATREALDLNFDAQHVKVGFMKPFMAAFTSDVTGYVSGKARLFGTFKDIDLSGDVFAEDLHIKIDFTNTWYSATDSIHIKPGLINLNDITIRDTEGHTARLNGWLKHDYFHSPIFEFNITQARNFLSYNVTPKINPDWYGTIYGNGSASVKGSPGIVEIGVKMSTAPHSTFTFVLSDRLDAEQYSFITFNDCTEVTVEESLIAIDDVPAAVKEYQARQAAAIEESPSTYLMNIKMDITPDAELIIVMDPVGGDRIRAVGSGDMAMEYNSDDNSLGMRGTYTLDEGNYNFTLQDIIIKDFSIESGSSITFKGDPYSAELNLQAAYSLNANLSDLDESFTQDRELNRTNVPVQALLNVTGDMRQPEISFDLRFPTLTSDTYRKVRSIISTEDMMSRQIIYLLALNRFYTPDYMASTTKGNEIFSVAASTITSQISNMLGKLSDKWSIAPNLRSDRGDFSDVEVDVALSSRLLNNRLLLNGNFGYRDKSLNTNQFIGDFDIEYLLTPTGIWRLKAYNRYNDQNYYLRQAATTQGIGIMFKREFDSIADIFRSRKHTTQPDSIPVDSTSTPTLNPQ